MPRTIWITVEAKTDLRQAKEWYDSRRSGLSEALANEINAALLEIAEHPMRWPIVLDEVRRYRLDKFPYAIPYLITDARIIVLGVIHAARDPSLVQRRLTKHRETKEPE